MNMNFEKWPKSQFMSLKWQPYLKSCLIRERLRYLLNWEQGMKTDLLAKEPMEPVPVSYSKYHARFKKPYFLKASSKRIT